MRPDLRGLLAGRTWLVVVAACCFVAALCSCSQPPDLSTFEAAHGWSPQALEQADRVLWRANVGRGHSALVAGDGAKIFTMGSRAVTTGGKEVFRDVVVCLDAATGQELWTFSYPCDDIYFPGPRATPAFAGNRVYTLSWQGHLFCLDSDDGSVVWQRHLVDEGLATPGHWGLSGSPVVSGDLVVVTAGASGAAFNRHTGATAWSSEAVETSLPSPVVIDSDTGHLAVVPNGDTLYGVELETGQVVWSIERDADSFVDPFLAGSTLLMPGPRGIRLVDVSGHEPHLILDSPKARFSEYQGYAVVENHLYGFNKRRLQCVDLASGQVLWRTGIGNHGSLVVRDGMLLILEGDGHVSIARASPEGFTRLARTRVLEPASNRGVPQPLQHHCWTRPTMAGGILFVRSNDGDIACVDLRV
jgi:outer membrane protein assembly factor BamB